MSQSPYYEGFTERWTEATDTLADRHGLDSVLIMQSTPTHMVTAAGGDRPGMAR